MHDKLFIDGIFSVVHVHSCSNANLSQHVEWFWFHFERAYWKTFVEFLGLLAPLYASCLRREIPNFVLLHLKLMHIWYKVCNRLATWFVLTFKLTSVVRIHVNQYALRKNLQDWYSTLKTWAYEFWFTMNRQL